MSFIANITGFLAFSNHVRGKQNKARGLYKKAFESGMNNIKYLTTYGVLSMRDGEFEKAIDLFNRAIRRKPKLAERNSIRTSRAIAYLKSGDQDSARAALEDLHEKYRSLRVYQALGYLYIVTNDEKAEAYLKEALEYVAEDPVNLDNMGQYLISKGQFEKARPYLEKANEIKDGKIDVLYHLAQVEQASGNIEKAIEYLDEADECNISAVNDATKEKLAALRAEISPRELG